METPELGSFKIEQEIRIFAPRAKVFECLTRRMGEWWGSPYLLTDDPKDLRVELKVGGRVYEDIGNEEGGLWGIVSHLKAPERIEWRGAMGMSGAITGVVCFELEEQGTETLVKLWHWAAGQVTQKHQQGYSSGWKDLTGRLKALVETGERMGIRRA